jgi:hypothetical protein
MKWQLSARHGRPEELATFHEFKVKPDWPIYLARHDGCKHRGPHAIHINLKFWQSESSSRLTCLWVRKVRFAM